MFWYDNVVFPTAPQVSWYGLLFAGASGNEYNLFSDSPTVFELYKARSGVGYLDHSVGAITVAPEVIHGFERDAQIDAVPEPATWMMLLLGFGGVGAYLRRQRRAIVAA
jgi:hypothetical protein